MLQQPMTLERRNDLMRHLARAGTEYELAVEKLDRPMAALARKQRERIRETYYEELPAVVMGCCPFDGKPLVRSFDPYGLDGPWWQPDAQPSELPTCTHFCVLRGAVNYHNVKPRAGGFEVHTGPEVPYVIPRILDKPGMIAVIASLEMKPGYVVYTIAYFAKRRPPVQELTAHWPRKMFTYTDAFGQKGWDFPNDPWDFELLPWGRKGKLRWCPPQSDNTRLTMDPPSQCPYLNIEGQRDRIVVQGDQFWTEGLPDGRLILPMDAD